ncbi:MAG: DNA-processing protein DprA [Alphaproteobacteria bacterium]|nr:DNA-processing protein DprA [Alphaproteobacteria bacterium]
MDKTEDILDYLQLINTENIGPKTFIQLCNKYGSAKEALKNLPSKYLPFSREKAKQELKLAEHLGVQILICISPKYPQTLLNIPDYPPVLYAKGNCDILNFSPTLAIVGSRNASINGRKLASKIAYDLTNQKTTIVSGMARGIDAAAHKGALYALKQQGPTIAVLGTGVDIPYPAENKELYQQICAQGCLISEFPLGTKPQANNFPRRNRIISGLSSGILVVEANLHSGSLITAYTAAEQGHDVMAIPGSPLDGRAEGTNKLIKDGAYLVENADDILAILSTSSSVSPQQHCLTIQKDLYTTPLDNEIKTDNIPQQKSDISNVIDFLTPEGVYVDEIIQISGLDSATINAELLYLELEGKIVRQPGNKVALIK